jgi:hypothetical protein
MTLFEASKFDFVSLADLTLQLLTVAYGVFATSTDFKETGADGKKHLSKVGRIGIAFLLVNSIAGVALKVYQHHQDELGKEKAQAQQQKMVSDLELGLERSAKLQSDLQNQTQEMSQQTSLMQKQNGDVRAIITEGQRTYHQTSRLLSPIEQKAYVSIEESLSFDDPGVRSYVERIQQSKLFKNTPLILGPFDERWPKDADGALIHGLVDSQRFGVLLYPPNTEFVTDRNGKDPWADTTLLGSIVSCGAANHGPPGTIKVEQDKLRITCGDTVLPFREHGARSYEDLRGAKAFIHVGLFLSDPGGKVIRSSFHGQVSDVSFMMPNRIDKVVAIKRIACPKSYEEQVCFSGTYQLDKDAGQ